MSGVPCNSEKDWSIIIIHFHVLRTIDSRFICQLCPFVSLWNKNKSWIIFISYGKENGSWVFWAFFCHLLFRIGQSFLNNITLSMYFLMSFWSSHKRNLLPCGCLQELILILVTSSSYDHFFKFLRWSLTRDSAVCLYYHNYYCYITEFNNNMWFNSILSPASLGFSWKRNWTIFWKEIVQEFMTWMKQH